ncbi:hypothetical protein D9758_001684 [Tetrapyrgos nigripes]|uniref:Uncharacterized protein n=1 Tax=Tetrapyrgos nigripes TaxID=182062 RepID=A0A8H5GXU3_9AGAR|nr:hypothetical protein D9758_001684 [Tetrapyrgos nigripes]
MMITTMGTVIMGIIKMAKGRKIKEGTMTERMLLAELTKLPPYRTTLAVPQAQKIPQGTMEPAIFPVVQALHHLIIRIPPVQISSQGLPRHQHPREKPMAQTTMKTSGSTDSSSSSNTESSSTGQQSGATSSPTPSGEANGSDNDETSGSTDFSSSSSTEPPSQTEEASSTASSASSSGPASSEDSSGVGATAAGSTPESPGSSAPSTSDDMTTYPTDTTQSTPNTNTLPSSAHVNVGGIAGGVVGGLILVTLVTFIVIFLLRRRRNRTAPSAEFLYVHPAPPFQRINSPAPSYLESVASLPSHRDDPPPFTPGRFQYPFPEKFSAR